MSLKNKIKTQSAKIAIIGGGYVGLPLAVECAEGGFPVAIYDVDKKKVNDIKNNHSYIKDVLSKKLEELEQEGNKILSFSTHQDLKNQFGIPDISIICVPTPLTARRDPDISYVLSAIDAVKGWEDVTKEQLAILESTIYPGFSKEILAKKLNNFEYIAFSPERVDPGNKDFNTYNTPKLVGGIDKKSIEVASDFYINILEQVVPVSSCEVAEMCKILENTFRLINIGFINEVTLMCKKMDIDIWEVIRAAKTKPFGFMSFTPGIPGGHCLPTDPYYLEWQMKNFNYKSKFTDLTYNVNLEMLNYIMSLTQDGLNSLKKPINGSNILVVGVAYKPDIDDVRESPAIDIMEQMKQKGANVDYFDPYVEKIRMSWGDVKSEKNFNNKKYDCAIIVTNHSGVNYQNVLSGVSSVVDTRNALENVSLPSSILKISI